MNMPRILLYFTLFLFGVIGIAAVIKQKARRSEVQQQVALASVEIKIDPQTQTLAPAAAKQIAVAPPSPPPPPQRDEKPVEVVEPVKPQVAKAAVKGDLPDADRIDELFNKADPRLPIVETITYKSRVSWLKGRPAWLSDYASHYKTSRHFIARSLNGRPDYLKQEISEGDRFNVLRQDIDFSFYLLIDSSRCRLWFYYIDEADKQPVLIKTYSIGLGRVDPSKRSGLLTPLGKYTLGNKTAIYQPKSMGTYHGKNIEMITVFGTRWIPFEKEIGECTAPAKGFGIHGTPWNKTEDNHLKDNSSSLGKYESDGCIRMASSDVEELYSIVITRPTVVEIVRDFYESTLHPSH